MKADVVLYNGRIYTVDPHHPWAEAVACHQGKIMAVGRNEEMLSLAGSQTERIEVAGRLVLPGIIYAHIHFL